MSVTGYLLGLIRAGVMLIPWVFAAHRVRRHYLPLPARSLRVLAEACLVVCALALGAELLGLFGLDRWWSMALLAGAAALASLPLAAAPPRLGDPPTPAADRLPLIVATVAVAIVVTEWLVLSADALGGGILSFDSLWYHLPFAAFFAQTGSSTRVLFTQADPFVAYYPATAELLQGLGIMALRNDFLAPLQNLFWLALGLQASWCVGRRWGREPLTLTAGALVISLPVLSSTQPGSGANDIAGLALFLAGIAFTLQAGDQRGLLLLGGLALGLALGVKLTFVIPSVAMVLAGAGLASPGRRWRALGLLGAPCLAAGGWWYLRAVIKTGSPIGLQTHIGPIVLSGAASPLSRQETRTAISALVHPSLWGPRILPAFNYSLGPLWSVVIVLSIAGLGAALLLDRTPALRALAVCGLLAGLVYLVIPTGAYDIQKESQLFAVDLRYATPALTLGWLALVLAIAGRRPDWTRGLSLGLLIVLIVTQFQGQLWPRQTAGHLAVLVALAVAAAAVWWAIGRSSRVRWGLLAAALGVAVLAGLFAERHYFNRRYLTANARSTALGQIFAWAQHVADSRIAVYGGVEIYPLYGARDTNHVVYLGQPARHGGYLPIATCTAWRHALYRGRYSYLVLTPGPTVAAPASWTSGDRAATLALAPYPGSAVYRLAPGAAPTPCA